VLLLLSNFTCVMFTIVNLCNCIGGVMVSVLASSVVDRWFESRSSQAKQYLLLLCYARSIKEKEQILVGSESG
jgi:hypothetical protein